MSRDWQLKNIYLYLVCFVTLMMIIFGVIFFCQNVVSYFVPVHYSSYLTLMDIEQEYLQAGKEVPPLEELKALRDSRNAQNEQMQKNDRIYRLRSLAGSLAVWLIPLPFYLYHWRKIKEDLFSAGEGRA
ncbi:MAG: hypothetical protein GX200_02510 [Firmicutes bacterium]|nr:hypothetical protein [Bacillota bacterium]